MYHYFVSYKKHYICIYTSINTGTPSILFEYELDLHIREKNESAAKANCEQKGVEQNAEYGAAYQITCTVKQADM